MAWTVAYRIEPLAVSSSSEARGRSFGEREQRQRASDSARFDPAVGLTVEENVEAALLEANEHLLEVIEAARHETLGAEPVLERGAAANRRVHDPIANRHADRVDALRLGGIKLLIGDVVLPVVFHGGDGELVAL